MKSLGMPPRSLTKTTVWPVLGFQAGEVLAPLAKVRRLGWPPLESVTKSSALHSIEDEKMICEPSGDQAGELLVPRNRGKETTLLASTEYMHSCGLTTPLAAAKQVKAMRDASGDHLGVKEMVCREVRGCWLAPS